jgi:hypothetical protein
MLTAAEFEAVEATHHPQLRELSPEELQGRLKLLRDYRDKAGDVARRQRREMRGKSEPRGVRPARDDAGTVRKRSIFVAAMKRLNQELERRRKAERRESQCDIARRALALKRANRGRRRPDPGRTAGEGMRAQPSPRPTVEPDPREVGRVSQFVKVAQARRDS